MINYLQKTIPQLSQLRKTLPASEERAIARLLKSISDKKPLSELKKLDLTKYETEYSELSKLTTGEIATILKKEIKTRPIIEILICSYILYASETKLVWSKRAPAIHFNEYHNQDIAFFRHQNSLKPIHQPEKSITKFIHGRRSMPSSAPFPGIYDAYRVAYMIEIRDNMGPYSGVDYQSLKKGVQTGGTAGGVEDCIAYYWKERPADQMYLTGTKGLLKKFNTKRLGPLMESAGLIANTQLYNKRARKSGDTIEIKEYYGGNLTMGSIQSGAHARSDSIMIMYVDEIDLAEAQMASGEGNVLDVLDGRLTAFEGRSKMFSLSTPRVYGNSLIDIQYERGDKRKYFVPCPHCGKMQWLCLGDEKSNYGLKGDFTAGTLENGYYLCYHCHDAIFEGHKAQMIKSGFWQPTVDRPAIKNNRSYHLPSFYSPFMSWKKIVQKWVEADKEGDDGMRSFTNLYLGKSFEPSGERPDISSVIEIKSKHKSGEVPNGILYLTMAADIQRGKDRWKKHTNQEINKIAADLTKKKDWKKLDALKLPRLEVEVIGHGRNFRTASIIYKKFYGQLSDYTAGAWLKFTEWRNIDPGGLKFQRADGFEFPIRMIFVDSGWSPTEEMIDVVYNYCHMWDRMYSIKGAGTYRQDKQKMNDITPHVASDIMRFKLTKSGEFPLILIHGNYYKRMIYRNFKNDVTRINDQPPNTHITPSDYPDSYFEALRAEKQKSNGEFWNPSRKPNEALDLLVYNKAASDFFIQDEIIRLQEVAKVRFPQLKNTRSSQVREKLNELANRRIVTDNFEKMLRSQGWGPVISDSEYNNLYGYE